MIQLGTDPFCTIFENDTKGVCPQLYHFNDPVARNASSFWKQCLLIIS